MDTNAQKTPEREVFYQKIGQQSVTPLWEVLGALVPKSPSSPCVPAHWAYDDMRPWLMEAGQLITAKEAERRVLILENPGLPGESSITHSLYAGLQLILPGEIAPSHRHTQSALRFVLEGEGAYTAVDGERVTMHPGDFIITPSWTWHDHGNPGSQPVVWLDGLDIPTIRFFDAGFAERYPEEVQPVSRDEGEALANYGNTLLPLNYKPQSKTSPLFCYPYARSRETLDVLSRRKSMHPAHGFKMQYINPATGSWPMPTIAAFIQLLPKGFSGRNHRSTDATVYSVVEGHGEAIIGEQVFRFAPRDVFVVPSWTPCRFNAGEEVILFSFSDRPVQEAIGVWREAAE